MPNEKEQGAGAGPESLYQRYLASGEFRLQRCDNCETHVFYPRYLCPECGSSRLSWIRSSGAGTVYSTTVMRRRPEHGGDFNVALIELKEGPRLMSRVDGVPPDTIRIGMPVQARITDDGQNGLLLVFEPAGDADGR